MNWRTDILPVKTKRGLDHLRDASWLAHGKWYLAGGTALALQVGHRQSVDLDFFTTEKIFTPESVLNNFGDTEWRTDTLRENTIYGELLGAKASFIAYPFFIPAKEMLRYGSVPVLDKDDIAVMKIVAISQRGKKRDFVDLYWYSKNVLPLATIIEKLPMQYPTVAHDYYHIIKSLTYFDDAEEELMPPSFSQATWEEIKGYFRQEVPAVSKRILHLG